ncbi:MAG TPA: hypothetical protein VN522_10265 [Solirubrobacterales bacterium]|nr:hypothetical protein [Solirubrobacterales bacterium]
MKTRTNTRLSRWTGLYLAALTATISLLAALATGAGAAPPGSGFEMARFKVEIEGWSKTTWHSSLEAETECDTSDHSFGSERFTFATMRPFVITATHFAGEFNPRIFSGRSALGAPVVARINNSYTPVVASPAKTCEDNGGGAEPEPYDCGLRVMRDWHVELEFSEKKKNGLQLHGDTTARRPYEHCPTASFTYPFLLDVRSARTQEPLFANLSVDDLFDPTMQKWITIGRGTLKDDDDSLSSTTHVHWTVSFTRLKGK